ncbi:hypothetical protein VSN93_16580 [Acinetobacter johnsonii]|uniref:hypothetical protein n=1 Tax=Acinetobacter johnsonii TaxID=40214 RepID=UPI000FB7BE32|nr:hypothetical protein [Acinetobacter johnsonii]MCS3526707.1 hypothetical protein [Acinetobacter johnsonii]
MIGITKDGRLVAIKKNSSTGGLRFVGILITDPQELSDNYKQIKLHFQSPSDQYNLTHCQDILHIPLSRVEVLHGEQPLVPCTSSHLLRLSIHQFLDGFQIDVRTKIFGRLRKILSKKFQS